MRAVGVVVEHEGQRRHAAHFAEVGGEGDRLRAERDRLTALAVVVQRHLVLERAVQIRVDERDPAVGRLHHEHRKGVAVGPVPVQVGGGQLPERPFRQNAGIPRGRGRKPADPTGPGKHSAGDRDGAVARCGDGRQSDHTLPGEIPDIERLGGASAGDDETVHAWVYAGVEDGDQDAAPVIGGVSGAEVVDARAVERHQADEQRACRWQDGETGRDAGGRRRRCGRRRWTGGGHSGGRRGGRRRSRGGRVGGAAAAGGEGDEQERNAARSHG